MESARHNFLSLRCFPVQSSAASSTVQVHLQHDYRLA